MKSRIARLILIYNADSGKWNTLVDIARKLLSIDECDLCSITYGALGEKREWKDCKEELALRVDTFHRDEIRGTSLEQFSTSLPSVIAETEEGKMALLLSNEELATCHGSPSDLKGKILQSAAEKDLEFPQE
ncbi:hypothetical protein L0156_07245 [bacterium]|nr:hypothetical protein [bacterium]